MLCSNFERFYDFLAVKHDCVFGENFDLNEITYVSEVFFNFNYLTFITTSSCKNTRSQCFHYDYLQTYHTTYHARFSARLIAPLCILYLLEPA